jgi:ABC-type transport system substrate-binding protein
MSRLVRALLVVLIAGTLASCSTAPRITAAAPSASDTPPALSEEDTEALATLAAVAGPTSNVDPETITRTECWLPSDHLIEDETVSDTSWRVLCRAHYVDDSGDRYQDATCVGDFAVEPMLEHCYRWAYYTGMPMFEDFPAVAAD